MKKTILYNIFIVLIIAALLIFVNNFIYNYRLKKFDKKYEKKLNKTEIRHLNAIDSLNKRIQALDTVYISKKEFKNTDSKLVKEISIIRNNQKKIINDAEEIFENIINSSDSADWQWFKEYFSKLHDNSGTIKTDPLLSSKG